MTDETDFRGNPLLEAVSLGLDVRQFERSPGGLALIELAMGDLNESLLTLIGEPMATSERAIEAHAQARKAYGVMEYLRECIQTGDNAEDQLRQMDEDPDHE